MRTFIAQISDEDFDNADFTFEDCGYEGEGLVHFCHCTNCGAEIEYRIPLDDDTCE